LRGPYRHDRRMVQNAKPAPPRLRHYRLWLAMGWGLVVLIVYLSLGPPLPTSPVADVDKLEHLLAYLSLTLWFGALYAGRTRLLYALGFLIMGALLEWMQAATPYRFPDPIDMLANALGVGCGLALAYTRASWFLEFVDRRL
jgi:VanZ family protein